MLSDLGGKAYWRSLDELADAPEFRARLEREFPEFAPLLSGTSRRQFLKLMGASLALGGLTACRWPQETIVPYVRRPAGRTPGVPVQYATTFELGGAGIGVLASSFDGRPIKLEGNPLHPGSRGASSAIMQAAILEMYDPDRSISIRVRRETGPAQATFDQFDIFANEHFLALRTSGGTGLRVLSETSSSPTLAALKKRFAAVFPQARWYEYEPISFDNERAGTLTAFGAAWRPQYRFDQADVIVCLDADPLLTHPAALQYTRDFASRRTAGDEHHTMCRLYAVESGVSLTGSNADHRYAVRSSQIPQVLVELCRQLAALGVNVPVDLAAVAGSERESRFRFVERIARDLADHRGRAVLLAGPGQPPAVHAVVHLLNNSLGSIGGPVQYTESPDAQRQSHADAIATLADEMSSGAVSTLVILGGNPVYNAPADVDFATALGKVATSIHLSLYRDETSSLCTWHVPRAHFLEAWGDAGAYDGTYSLVQPLIEPLYGGRTVIELVAQMTGEAVTRGYELVRKTFKELHAAGLDGDAFERAWRKALHDGVVAGSAAKLASPTISAAAWGSAVRGLAEQSPAASGDEFEVVFAADSKVYDGRFANNGWLQELPDPLTKLTWDNAALISPADARRLGVDRNGRMLRVSVGGQSLTLPAYVLPGHAVGVVTLPLGYGRRESAGAVAGGVGFNTYSLRSRSGWWVARGAQVSRTDGLHVLATTQDHHAMESEVGTAQTQKRIPALFREGTLDEYRAYLAHGAGHSGQAGGHGAGDGHNGAQSGHGAADAMKAENGKKGHQGNFAVFASRGTVHPLPLVQPFGSLVFSDAPRWAMAIDLSRCTGCAACVVACQAENNIPVVGKDEVLVGREMHWIRIDRYFRGDPDDPQVVHQPVTCHQCENAPCEQVCPVAATVHDEQGLNVMVYNRCIGTRYCSNNCPYKVRRFNWFFNHHGPAHPRSRKLGGPTVFMTLNIKEHSTMQPQQRLTELEKLRMNPNVTVRSRGVMEKCTFCVQRIEKAKIAARNAEVSPIATAAAPVLADGSVTPACAEACPAEAILFGDLRDEKSRVAALHGHERSYAMLEELNVRPRLKYLAKLRNTAGGAALEHVSG